jgi:ATP synthase subunit D
LVAPQAARKKYIDAIQLLVELASLQTAFLTLDEAIKTTNRRVNALDSVVRPRLENTIAYIKVGHWLPAGYPLGTFTGRSSLLLQHTLSARTSPAGLVRTHQ